ncbi:MAG: peptidase T [Phycisphaerales bacterium]|nr:peptidase T [Phycisphaerales bacterium]
MNELLERFLRYVRVETTAVEQTDKYPSSPGQLELGRMLADELRTLKLIDVVVSAHGIVTATIPPTHPKAPTIAWFAHMDTSPEFTAHDVKPVVHRDYDGRDIVLPGDTSRLIRVADNEGLAKLKGRTLVTTDGTTLLGADDKAGVAVVMTAAARLMSDAKLPRGPIRVVFTCDEEVGRGVDKVDLKQIGAVVGYTLDGDAAGIIDNETFSADLAVVTVTGRNTHPGYATGKMVNAIRVASAFVARMPTTGFSPETTSDRRGFLHPYVFEGGVEQTRIRVLLRSFVTAELAEQAEQLRAIAKSVGGEFAGARIEIEFKKQYRNMAEHLSKEPRVVALAEAAMRDAGMTPEFKSIRGGTDGSRLSELGLPTPNLSTGMYNYHSPLEFACVEEMESAVEVLLHLAKRWSME